MRIRSRERGRRAAGTFALNVALAASGAMLSGELFPFVPSGDALPSFLADYAAVAALFFLLGAWCSRGFRVQRAAIFS